jgi:hypothetical protein
MADSDGHSNHDHHDHHDHNHDPSLPGNGPQSKLSVRRPYLTIKYGRSADWNPPIRLPQWSQLVSVSQLIDRTKLLHTVDELKVCCRLSSLVTSYRGVRTIVTQTRVIDIIENINFVWCGKDDGILPRFICYMFDCSCLLNCYVFPITWGAPAPYLDLTLRVLRIIKFLKMVQCKKFKMN